MWQRVCAIIIIIIRHNNFAFLVVGTYDYLLSIRRTNNETVPAIREIDLTENVFRIKVKSVPAAVSLIIIFLSINVVKSMILWAFLPSNAHFAAVRITLAIIAMYPPLQRSETMYPKWNWPFYILAGPGRGGS